VAVGQYTQPLCHFDDDLSSTHLPVEPVIDLLLQD
jgi:hypothetical protein